MKNLIIPVLLLVCVIAFSQKTDENYTSAHYRTSVCRSSFEKIKLEGPVNEDNVRQYLKKNMANLKDGRTELKLNYVNESPGGYHYSFTQIFNQIEVYQSEVKVNIDRQNTIRSVFDNTENTIHWSLNTAGFSSNFVIAVRMEIPYLCERKIRNNSIETLETGGEIFFEHKVNSYFAQDSIVSGRVFNPDPLTTAQQGYGLPYFDNLDATNSGLDGQLQTVTFKARYDNGVFTLESPFVRLSDFDLPSATPVTSTNGQFYYNRSQTGFEDVNAFYHISTIQQHIQSLGFNCADSLIDIDPHAVSGDDNSYFSPLQTPKRIYFGTGGVDDAEDADVCVHEYGHFVSEMAAPGSNNGMQRESIDEGFGDYLAGSYSRSLNTYADNWVFNWDGHNEFWNGRVLNATWIYPDDLNNNIYHNGQIWGATLWCINGWIGRNTTDSIVLQAQYSYSQNMSMQDAAQLLLDADTVLTGGKYSCPVYCCLFQRGLAPQNPFISCNCTVGIKEEKSFPVQFISQYNSFSLVNPGGEHINLQISNMQGQLVSSVDESQQLLNFQNSTLPSGVYLVNIRLKDSSKTFKWSKLN